MVNGQLDPILRHIRALIGERAADGTDGQLLEQFAACREETAFAALVQRYGRLVFGVCRRVLRHAQDAEDAFQATFLILAHKAASVRKRESVASWLYGVAYRVALKTKTDAARRREHEREAPTMSAPEPHTDLMAHELAQIIDEELNRLPERYRVPVVLCCLAGKTQEQAARELGWPVGSMSRWLTRGKEMLRKRLVRRGVTISTPLLGAVLTEMSAEAAPAMSLAAATVKAAVGLGLSSIAVAGLVSTRVAVLTEGVLRTMMLTKMPMLKTFLLAVVLVVSGAGVLAFQKPGPGPGQPSQPGNPSTGTGAPAVPGSVAIRPEADDDDEWIVPVLQKNKRYVKAEVSVLMSPEGKRRETPIQLILTDRGLIKSLADFFPEMGQAKVGDAAGAWKAGIVIKFHPAKGDPIKVSVHWEGEVWSEGNGDWDARGGLWPHLLLVIADVDAKKLQGTWKVISIEENGKKRPGAEVKDMKWSIRDSRITYWQADRRMVRQFHIDPTQQPKWMGLTRDPKDPAPDIGPTGGGAPGGSGDSGGGRPGIGGGKGGGGGPPGMGTGMPVGTPMGGGFPGGMPGMMGGSGKGMAMGMGSPTYPCIYALDGDELKICESLDFNQRPADFTAKEKSNRVLYVLKRITEAKSTDEQRMKEPAGDWSKPVNGLSGRLLVAFEDLKPGLRHAVTLELKNVSTDALAVVNQPKLEVSLFESSGFVIPSGVTLSETKGLAIPPGSFPMSGPIPNPQWGVIPRDSYMGFRVDMRTVGVPTKEQALLAVGGKHWGLKPGKYSLLAKLIAAERGKEKENQWGGEMDLPPVEIVITKEQVAER